jgi:hypothetical protein
MPTSYAKRTTENLVADFAKAASQHGQFMASCDPKRANAKFDQMAKLYGELRRRGLQAQRQLLPLFESDNPHIRFHAATYALDFEPEQGVRTLTRILHMESGALRFDARMTLDQWHKSEIRFSWVPK